jgi:thioredoxin reductase (NADPH)
MPAQRAKSRICIALLGLLAQSFQWLPARYIQGIFSLAFHFYWRNALTTCVADLIECDDRGYILSGADLTLNGRRPRHWPLERKPYLLETNVPGIFVAGDVRHGSIKRVASAVGEGSIAIELIHQYLDR